MLNIRSSNALVGGHYECVYVVAAGLVVDEPRMLNLVGRGRFEQSQFSWEFKNWYGVL